MSYRVEKTSDGFLNCIRRLADNAGIPKEPGNKDYDAFVLWNNAQPVPLVVPDPPTPMDALMDIRQAINDQKAVIQADGFSAADLKKFLKAQFQFNKAVAERALGGKF